MTGRGAAAEELAVEFLGRRGIEVIARNYRCRGGEVDIIAWDGATLVFVEVRLRADERFGGAAASVTLAKQRRIALAASHFLSARTEDPLVRFDVLTLDALDSASITWLKAAFDA